MTDKPQLRVIAYDIVSDRRRRKIAETLEASCVRVQDSVFEARLSHRQADRLMTELKRLAAPEDLIRLYTIPDAALPRCASHGGAAILDGARFWLL